MKSAVSWGNRELFMDQYCALVLLYTFNPCVRSRLETRIVARHSFGFDIANALAVLAARPTGI
jgi:hypothetical protein